MSTDWSMINLLLAAVFSFPAMGKTVVAYSDKLEIVPMTGRVWSDATGTCAASRV